MKKLKAFTLMELLVGMVISGLVIAFGAGAYQVIGRQFMQYKKVKQELMEAAMFRSVMENDCFNASAVYGTADELQLANGKQAIKYKLGVEFILRTVAETSDTFRIAVSGPQLRPVREGSALLDQVEFKGNVCGELQDFSFSKQYDAAVLMNEERRSHDQGNE
jgi:prepilin-type N-terminal cleavage/methylation domain-containing protein